MGFLTKALTYIDESHLRRFPTTTPRLYSKAFNALYDSLDPPEGSACGDDDWADLATVLDDESPKGPDGERLLDCFPVGTLLLRDDYELVPIEDIRVGDRIWGRDEWSTVEAKEYKGLLSVDGLVMNNGSVVQLTGDHHLFIGRCERHAQTMDDGYGCSCRLEERKTERVRLRDLVEKQVLVTPNRIRFGEDDLDPDRAYVEALYVSEGWSQRNSEFSISGQDGCPKETQKREVEKICARLGISTRWNRKSIAVKDGDWTLRVHEMGRRARYKRVLSLDLGEASAVQTIRGLMADSNTTSGGNANGGWTFTTTSCVLATQMRVLQKMIGRTTSIAYFTAEQHRGLGRHGIWRIGIRDPKRQASKLLRVKRIERDVAEVPCYDIQTSDHYVYLPEHDVTVSNCEDAAGIRAAEANVIFIPELRPKPVRCSCCEGTGFVLPRVEPYVLLHRDWVRDERGNQRRRHLYHVVDKWPEGLPRYPNTVKQVDGMLIEDPAEVLGMGR